VKLNPSASDSEITKAWQKPHEDYELLMKTAANTNADVIADAEFR
jgi:hypothetical protein